MLRSQMLAELREVLRDSTTSDTFWSDSLLLSYLAEGQDEFCERTGYFSDFTNHSITLVAGTAVYAIPDRVIEVMDIWDGTRRLGKFEETDRFRITPDWLTSAVSTQTGRPQVWQADQSTGSITFDRVPTAAEAGTILQMRTWRYSLFALDDDDIDPDVDGVSAEPEIPSRFHRALIEWAAYKAMMSHDAEKQDKIKAGDHFAVFTDYVTKGKRALKRIQGQTVRVGTAPAYRT